LAAVHFFLVAGFDGADGGGLVGEGDEAVAEGTGATVDDRGVFTTDRGMRLNENVKWR
jgi:hypothetical protein